MSGRSIFLTPQFWRLTPHFFGLLLGKGFVKLLKNYGKGVKLKSFFHLSGFKIAFLLSLAVLGIYYLDPDFLSLLELKTLDLRFLSRGKVAPSENDSAFQENFGFGPRPAPRGSGLCCETSRAARLEPRSRRRRDDSESRPPAPRRVGLGADAHGRRRRWISHRT